jgi:septum formation inhibitor MinC
MNEELLSKLRMNLKETPEFILNNEVIQNYFTEINDSIQELNNLLEDIKNNNMLGLEKKQRENLIEKKSMEPFIKYLMIYNTFLNNSCD